MAMGRSIGYRKEHLDYKHQYANEIELLTKGYTIREISSICRRSPNTILKLKKMFL